jgi:uncharacterized protein YjbI with pentapeptide repeats
MVFRGQRLDDADFSGARLHAPNLESRYANRDLDTLEAR